MLKFLKRSWFNIFLYASIIFLIYYLIENDILYWPKIHIPVYLIIAFIFLLGGFFLEMFAWFSLLQVEGIKVDYQTIIKSSGVAILGKYIPGKIWTVMGRAKIVADHSKQSLSTISFISFEAQIIFLWAGLLISLIGAITSNIGLEYVLLVAIFLLIFSLIIFTQKYKLLVDKILLKIFKRKYIIPKLNHKKGYILLLNFFPWVSWTIGFYLLMLSIHNGSLPISMSFSLVVSTTFGVIALFSPGGLGVREGIMTGYLTACGLDISTATTISIFSRLWFLIGELVIFIVAFILKILKK